MSTMNHDIDAAIFDMDGTLLDTMLYWRYTTLEYLLAHRIPFEPEDVVSMPATSSRRLVMEIAQRTGYDVGSFQAMVSELEGFMNRHYLYDAHLKPFVPELLGRLRAESVRMCVATGSPREYARNGLGRLGILDYFEFVTDHYEFGLKKDSPEYFRVVAERLGTVPERCVVFEDALYSMKAAKCAGCRVVAVRDDTAAAQREQIRVTADRYVEDFSELLG